MEMSFSKSKNILGEVNFCFRIVFKIICGQLN